MKEERTKIISVYFDDDVCDDMAHLEVQVSAGTADTIMDRIEEMKPDRMARLTMDTMINLSKVRAIKTEYASELDYEEPDDE